MTPRESRYWRAVIEDVRVRGRDGRWRVIEVADAEIAAVRAEHLPHCNERCVGNSHYFKGEGPQGWAFTHQAEPASVTTRLESRESTA